MIRYISLSFAFVVTLFTSISTNANVVLNFDQQDPNILVGASGFLIGGTLYNLDLVDGKREDVIPTIPDFHDTEAEAIAFAQSIELNVFNQFQGQTNQIKGCEIANGGCFIFVPSFPTFGSLGDINPTAVARKLNNGDVSTYFLNNLSFLFTDTINSTSAGDNVYAVFSVASPVPEPETYIMFLVGLGLLGFISRKARLV